MAPVIVHIDGVPGSGKTFICSKLHKDIVCVDTDDVIARARDAVDRDPKLRKKRGALSTLVDQMVRDLAEKNKDKALVFVGLGVSIGGATHRFFIKVPDLDATYRRLLLRELDKIVDNEKEVRRHIKSAKDVQYELFKAITLVTPFPMEFGAYLFNYKMSIAAAKKEKFKIKTQQEIIDIVNSLRAG